MPFKTKPPNYCSWQSMRDRCRNPKNRAYRDYGGRGIKVCDRWKSYAAFAADMGERPPGYTLERVDNDGDYTPENCRWASRRDQQRNRRINVYVTIEGARYLLAELADKSDLKRDTIQERAALGLTYAEVMSPERRTFKEGLAMGGRVSGDKRRAQTHCVRGHEFTPENFSLSKQGWRRCKVCRRI